MKHPVFCILEHVQEKRLDFLLVDWEGRAGIRTVFDFPRTHPFIVIIEPEAMLQYASLTLDFFHGAPPPVTIYLPLDLWQPAIGMGHLVA